ncbi:phosphotransferase family protein [Cellulomonas humilata]|uniref:Aminoglycoside phosphotransferase (APT) family kinase protein n=1 Tax=Cellulomonas humilata TaxID=144055 RepID=A0ABU0EBC3_9CELL|nr:aminoglycoside phosphotransferase family protein [Cellulomonas humilata]MDQ0372396.1 aminoglycoside phosphotransferase (APT) family kinase protein [Cellulomonas humilata]
MIDALTALVAPLGVLKDAELLTGGQFATTYRVTLADGRRVIVKTAPTGTDQLLAYEHDLLRAEALVYEMAASVPELKMPQVLLTDFTRTLLPSDALVVSHLPGVPLVDAGFGPADPRTAAAERGTGEVLAALHRLTGPAFGYPCGRQASSWAESFTGMVDELLDDAARWSVPVPAADVRAVMSRHATVLADVVRPALVHTDLWAGNLFVDPSTGELLGVIDPERAFWGDPLADLVGIDPMGREPGTPAVLEGYGPLDVESPSARTRMELYRMRLCLVMMIEITPRKFEGDWVEPHRTAVTANLHRALDALA